MTVKKILNSFEESTHIKLNKVCEDYGTSVYPKMRVADVLQIENSGISNNEYRFALQSHFDFVITNSNHTPIFAVEFDGPSHKSIAQIHRDETKDNLCEKFNFPILRINAQHLTKKYRNFDLLSWFIEVWFLQESFYEAQRNGHIPWDEPFDPMSFYYMSGKKEVFPLWLSMDLRVKIQDISKSKKCLDDMPSEWIGVDKQEIYYGLSWILISEKEGIVTKAMMRKKNFPIVISDILGEILAFQLYEELLQVLRNKTKPKKKEYIDKLIKNYSNKYEMRKYCSMTRIES